MAAIQDPLTIEIYGAKLQYAFERFIAAQNSRAGQGDPMGVKCWIEGEFSIAYQAGEFIHIVNTGSERATFRGYQIEPFATFHSTEHNVIGKIMSQDARIGSKSVHSSLTLPPRPKKVEPKRRRFIKLK